MNDVGTGLEGTSASGLCLLPWDRTAPLQAQAGPWRKLPPEISLHSAGELGIALVKERETRGFHAGCGSQEGQEEHPSPCALVGWAAF